jgi:hypothetical protein
VAVSGFWWRFVDGGLLHRLRQWVAAVSRPRQERATEPSPDKRGEAVDTAVDRSLVTR